MAGPVAGDALRVRQILTNFLGNGIKFTAVGGVRLRATRLDGRRVRFEVIDTGPGIDEATQERLFGRGEQVVAPFDGRLRRQQSQERHEHDDSRSHNQPQSAESTRGSGSGPG